MNIEKRYMRGLELRGEGDEKRLAGYAAVFNSMSEEIWGFYERLEPGAFKETLASAEVDVRYLFNHDANYVLGRYRGNQAENSLILREDSRGLYAEVVMPDTNQARDVYTMIKEGLVDAMSFAFRVVAEEWPTGEKHNGLPVRVIKKCELFDVSAVTYPAYPATSVHSRTIFGAKPESIPVEMLGIPLSVRSRQLDLKGKAPSRGR